ncbi:uncharacterized protein LOC109727527 [Ananas comosus]|uniref:Uncharacterized protein LOC109727527 n=1 Tax=Ananas comosus TaxID=4615 RepID=A0A6P5HAW2_ANACO|nr:uncharacterized protein LOC109727527 [Ananas comosus]
MAPRQPEMTRSAPSGWVFAAQAEEPVEVEERHVVAEGPERAFVIRKECSACPVQVGNWIMPIRMLMLKRLKDFDVILGMDWLLKYYVSIDCRNKVVTFWEPGQEEFAYQACKSSCFAATVSAMRARKLVNSDCVAYLATVVEMDRVVPALEELSVVREFSDVFPTELPRMPPNQKIEFVIDLIPGTMPISKAPYRMAPAELKELRAQLQVLLDKEFIRPSVSPWGALV